MVKEYVRDDSLGTKHPRMNVGIRGFGTYLPETVMTARQIGDATGVPEEIVVTKFGVMQKPVPGPDETPSYMAIEAARKALDMAGLEGRDIDLVIWNGAQHKDYPCWLAGLKVADSIGAKTAWSFDMEAMCGSMMVGLDVAKSMLIAKPKLHRVLLASGYRNLDLIDPGVPETHFMLDMGASGAAVVLEKDYDRNIVLESSCKGDGSFAEDCVVPVMGARSWPPSAGDERAMHFQVRNVAAFKKKLGERTLPNFFAVIDESLAASNLNRSGIDYLAILHLKRSAHDAVLAELGLDDGRTTYLDHYGHLGQNDQIVSIELGLAERKIGDGSTIVMVGAGIGFVWASTVVRWGPA